MVALMRLLVVFLGATLPLLFSPAVAGEVGVSYGRVANNLPDPASVVKLLQRSGITTVRLYDTDPQVLRALANTGMKVMVMMPNENLTGAARNPSIALDWVRNNVAAYLPATLINGVAVGNEVFEERPDLTRQLVPAMNNVQAALSQLGLADAVKVSTPIAFTALQDTFPPSSGRFRDDIAQPVMKPMLDLLQRTGSCLTMNIYPYFAYIDNPDKISLDYALGNFKTGVQDTATNLTYHSLLDAQLDATYYAMEKLGFSGSSENNLMLAMSLTETGGPTQGKPRHGKRLEAEDGSAAATVANAQAYNNYVINRVLSCNTGTPHRPDADMDVYIFALFNENEKGSGPDDIERYFGLFYPNMTKVYEFDFHGGMLKESWCVANASVGDAGLQEALDYACGNGADCSAIQPGASCFDPDTKLAHASYAVNSYYQRKHRAPGTCDFAGAAHVVHCQPKYGNRVLPSKAWIEETPAQSEGYAAV